MCKTFRFLVVGILLPTIGVFGQENARRTNTTTAAPVGLKSEVIRHPEFVPEDLESLVNYSPLVVRGIVSKQLATRCALDDCSYLYTDFEFTVKKLLKDDGTRRKFDKVIVAQDGGRLGNSELVVSGDSLMREGEEYVLCLAYDPREERLRYEGARWVVRGIWHGKFKIQDEKVVVEEKSIFKKTIHGSFNPKSVEDISAADLIAQIERAVSKK